MNDLIELIQSPRKYFSRDKDISMKFMYLLLLIFLALDTYVGVFVVSNKEIDKVTSMVHFSKWFIFLFSVVGGIIGTIIYVNIVYFVVYITCNKIEKKTYNKKIVKKLLYTSYVVPYILSYIITSIYSLLGGQSGIFTNIFSLIISALVSIFIYMTLKLNIKTKNVHKFLPVIIFIISIIPVIKYFIKLH
ncbi:YIP1 family protein [Clostridium tyrobutyricum]|uniref:YIP1 family protein n=1 Tax=Clostridium tyrobutyricum TaxID=1519 RepID=UPI001C38552D|nr:hypothetical protein [Clostridium tyrobutyricum]MBV4443206.1 hypothetical protein [Clostridium tyrobutyricum]